LASAPAVELASLDASARIDTTSDREWLDRQARDARKYRRDLGRSRFAAQVPTRTHGVEDSVSLT
jgi:hypothetical protein